MQYRVIGSNKDTGARMELTFEAESKAAAERKASQQGMAVNRVEDITDGHTHPAGDVRHSKRGGAGMGKIPLLILVVIVVAVAWYFFGEQIRRAVGM